MGEKQNKIKQIILNNSLLFQIIDALQNIYIYNSCKKICKALKSEELSSFPTNRFVRIKNGQYNYVVLSRCYIDNMISLMINAMINNEIPIVAFDTFNKQGEPLISWNQYFKQPFDKLQNTSANIRDDFETKEAAFKPSFSCIYNKRMRKMWCEIYKYLVGFNDETQKYINNELEILSGKKVLGVVLRGTDYLATKPKHHPKQPQMDKVIGLCKKYIKKYGYNAIYITTEDKTYVERFMKEFGDDFILTNKRNYFDEIYNELGSTKTIGYVQFNRENDNYLRGLEYLSSVYILSQCDSIVGGHCGASDMAIYFNNNCYKKMHIFKCGYYS